MINREGACVGDVGVVINREVVITRECVALV